MPNMRKDGIISALDFTKFVVAADGALIAFLTGTTFTQTLTTMSEKVVVIFVLFLLASSIVAGIFVYMRIATMLGNGHYDLKDAHLKWPGVINVFFFAVGATGLGVIAIFELFLKSAPIPEHTSHRFTLTCLEVGTKTLCEIAHREVLDDGAGQQNHK